jgi:O-antigen/teichoic acid export membrane protein
VLRHSFLNLLGLGLPLVVAIAAIPLLIDALGVERFGILTLIWALVSYFGLFDLGLGRALTRELAANRAHGEPATARRLASTALAVMGVLGLAAGVLLALGAESAGRLFGSEHNPSEVVHAVYAMAVAMPFILTTSGLRGILEADQAFGIVNAIRVPLGVYTFLAPVAVVHYWSNDLGLVAASLTGGRMLAYFAHAWFCRRATATGADRFRIDRGLLAVLLHYQSPDGLPGSLHHRFDYFGDGGGLLRNTVRGHYQTMDHPGRADRGVVAAFCAGIGAPAGAGRRIAPS